MIRNRIVFLLVAFMLVAALVGCAAPASPKIIHYSQGSTSSTLGAFPLAVKLAELVNAAAPEQVTTVVESGAAHDNLIKTREGMFHSNIRVM